MPKSFLVKNKKNFYSPSSARSISHSTAQENGLFFTVTSNKLIQSSHSAFESFNGSDKCKPGNKVKFVVNGEFPSIVSSSPYNGNLPENRQAKEAKLQSSTNGHNVAQDEHSTALCRETLKENIQEKGNEQGFHFPTVKGPLPQSTFICQLCKKVYTDAFSLAQHKCSGIKHVEHRCPECSKVFSCPANLASHRRWHRPRSPTSNKPLKLNKSKVVKEEQPKETSNISSDVILTSNDQQDNNQETCLENDDDSPDISVDQDENNNASSQGSEEKSGDYSCDQCGKTFRRQAYLRKHINYHGNSRPYPCQYCGKVFRSLTNRAKHVLNHAVGPKGYTCEVCENRFPNRTSLEKHSRIHTGEIFTCTQCGSTFYSSPGLQRHLAKAHSQTEDSQSTVLISAR